MPRAARKFGYTEVYHVIIRGINHENIFLDNCDRRKFLKELIDTKEEYKYEIYAFCLMDNHIHILLKDNDKKLSKIMQSLNIRYSSYFNKKYERVGHLFQNRFNSKCVENERYLLTVQRYIHQNPEIANIEKTEKYVWSSYKEYVGICKICNTKVILNLFGNESLDNFKKFTLEKVSNTKEMMDIDGVNRIKDEEAIKLISEIFKIKNIREILEYNKEKRDMEIIKIKKCLAIPNTQIARILGINRKIVERAK